MQTQSGRTDERFLGIEGGATQTSAILVDHGNHVLNQIQLGPANLQFLSDLQLIRHLQTIAQALPRPQGIGIGLAGGWAEADQARIRRAAAVVWPGVPCSPTHDLETALRAAGPALIPSVLVVSGTGSGCYGKTKQGLPVKMGGWGHLLGDQGSGYDIGLRALQTVILHFDRNQSWPPLGEGILRALQLNEPNDLIGWAQAAGKPDIASLAVEVFVRWAHRDKLASQVLAAAAKSLADSAVACAGRITGPSGAVRFVLSGSVLLKQPRFAQLVGLEIQKLRPRSQAEILVRESVWGAVELAREAFLMTQGPFTVGTKFKPKSRSHKELFGEVNVRSAQLSPTEARNPRSTHLDELSWREAIDLMLSEDASVPLVLKRYRTQIEKVGQAIVKAFRQGGRLFYVGAGTSGRLGVLDASECPPTFRTLPDLVQGIMAGGQTALWNSVEGAEDDALAGGRAIQFRGVFRRDLVLGIAASGTTSFVWGALREAKRRGATTVLLCFNPHVVIPPDWRPTIVLAPNLGPELLTGSTRLKAGTATKLLLNLFTTLSMVKTGKVMSNLMVDLHPANTKLRDRATRIVQALTEVDYATARQSLEGSQWQIRAAVFRLRRRAGTRARGISLGDTRR